MGWVVSDGTGCGLWGGLLRAEEFKSNRLQLTWGGPTSWRKVLASLRVVIMVLGAHMVIIHKGFRTSCAWLGGSQRQCPCAEVCTVQPLCP